MSGSQQPSHHTARRAAQLEAILQSAVDAIVSIDQHGIIESVNPATQRIFGYEPDELLGRNVSLLMPEPFRSEHDRYIANYLDTGQAKIIGIGREVIGMRKDGSTFPMELAVSEAVIEGRRIFTGVVRDLTQRLQAQQAEANLGRIIEDSLNEIYIFDAESLTFIQVNQGARRNLGYSMDELRGMTPIDIKPEVDEQSFWKLIEPLVAGEQEQIQFESMHRRKDGSTYFVEVHLQQSVYQGTTAFIAIALDVTERRRAEELMRVQQRAIEAASSGIVITDPNRPDNPIVICNAAFLEITGYREQDVLGQNCRFLQGDDRDQPAAREIRRAVERGEECRVLIRNYRKDGSMFWNDLQVSPVHDDQGRVTHFVGVLADVTERELRQHAMKQRIESTSEQLRAAESELIKQARLATLGQVFGGIAHEIRNPLNALRTSAYFLLKASHVTDEKRREHLERIDRQVSVIDNIVTALADVARLPDPTLSPVELAAWVLSAAREVSLPPNIEVCVELPEDLPKVMVDVNQVPIALKNLIRNARDAMPRGGKISISARSDGDRTELLVADAGEGISDDVLPRIMEPLFSTKADGMGLGLAISRAIIEKNAGSIRVESVPGEGTTFTVTFRSAQTEHPDP